ncbi:MAG: hypothetical protein WC360_05560 [Opitutales bacterium]|jgi:hypothetical protein
MSATTDKRSLSPIARLLPQGKEWFTAKEAADVIGRSAQYVRDCFDNQKLMGHAMNARGPSGSEKRRSYQIPRAALMLYLMETANYQAGDYAQRLCELLEHLNADERRRIAETLRESTASVWSR